MDYDVSDDIVICIENREQVEDDLGRGMPQKGEEGRLAIARQNTCM